MQRFEVDRSKADGRSYACRRCLDAKRRARARTKRLLTETYLRHIHS